MATLVLGQGGTQTLPDGQPGPLRQGRNAELVVTEFHGKYYEQTRRNRVYTANSASTGIALIVPATTGGHPTLWNPLGSTRNISIIRLDLAYVSGTHAPTALEWAATKNAGAQPATGAPILTATRVAVENAMVGAPVDSVAYWAPTTNTFTAAPVFFRNLGAGLHTAAAATAINADILTFMYDGDLVIPPNNALSLCSQAATTTALFQVSITFEEIDI